MRDPSAELRARASRAATGVAVLKAIASRENAAFKALAKLASSSAERRKRGESLIEGAHLLAAYLDSGAHPEEVVVTAAALEEDESARLVKRARPALVTVLADALFRAISQVDAPTGVLARVRTPKGTDVPEDAPLVLMLENIQDPGNVGTLLRSAAAAGAGHVMLSATCAFAWSPKVLRAAMGAHFALNIVEGVDLAAFLARYRGDSVALAARAERSLYDVDLRRPVAFLIGNEGAGLSEPIRASARSTVRIPMPGRMESLNAGVAGSLCLFEAVRQRSRA